MKCCIKYLLVWVLAAVPLWHIAAQSAKDHPLVQLMDRYRFDDPDTVLVLAKQGLKDAIAKGDSALLAESFYYLSDARITTGQIKEALAGLDTVIAVFKKIGNGHGMFKATLLKGIAWSELGDYNKSIQIYKRCKVIADSVDNKIDIGLSYTNMGVSYQLLSDYKKASDYYNKAMVIFQAEGDTNRYVISMLNVSAIDNQLRLFDRSLQLCKSLLGKTSEDQWSLRSDIYNNMALSYSYLDIPDSAIYYMTKSLELRKKINKPKSLANAYNNLGAYYKNTGNYAIALSMMKEAYKTVKKYGFKNDEAFFLKSIAITLTEEGKTNQAKTYLEKAMSIADSMHLINQLSDGWSLMAEIEASKGNYEEAYKAQQMFKAYSDSIFDEGNTRIIQDLESRYNARESELMIKNMQQKQQADEARLRAQKETLDKQRLQIISFIFGVCLLLVLIIIIYRSFRQKKRDNELIIQQKKMLEEQKLEVEVKNKEITDSITYAKRIQSAILPPNKLVKEYLHESFILYKPKDIVAGDFYWLQQINSPPAKGEYPKGEGVISPVKWEYPEGGRGMMNIPELKHFRKELRDNLTPAEAKLWTYLSGNKLEGRKFRRQHSIDKYILDFYCPSEKLAIELDGEVHYNVGHQEYDHERDLFLSVFGIKVIRFENKVVFEQPEMLLEAIKQEFGWYNHPGSSSHPSFAGGENHPGSSSHPSFAGGEYLVYFAAADCTGHGVPGAMVSVVCNNALNRAVREYGLTEPGKILDKARELVVAEFEKSEEDVKDGMDISLCALNGSQLFWAGANNPLWLIKRNEDEVADIVEVKPDKQPIGKYADAKPFTTHKIELQKGDSIYIFSDGFADQFGGPKGKKFKYKPFKKLLLSIQDKTMEEQCSIIDQEFEEWRGNLEQVDDVCIIGVRI